jgi:hypothetical protein
MPADVFVDFLERKLREHAVRKVVPKQDVLEHHARRLIEQDRAQAMLSRAMATLQAEAATTALPPDLAGQVQAALIQRPEWSWDQAVAALVRGAAP